MAGPQDDLDDAERALGTLPRAAEDHAAARRRQDWEWRLAPLAELVAPVPPSQGLLDRILARIGEEGSERALRVERARTARWRRATFAMAAAAAVAAVVAFVLPREPGPVPGPIPGPVPGPVSGAAAGPELLSVATTDEGAPALIISLDAGDGRARVRPVAIPAPGEGSLELWHIPAGGAPVSLGLIDAEAPTEVALRAAPGDLAAVSLEPAGGSPTGQPTGPVLYSGAFVSLR